MFFSTRHTEKSKKLFAQLPYGKWTCADGREVLFNREYQPIWQRRGNEVSAADPNEWVEWVEQAWFYDDAKSPFPWGLRGSNMKTRRYCAQILKDWGVWEE